MGGKGPRPIEENIETENEASSSSSSPPPPPLLGKGNDEALKKAGERAGGLWRSFQAFQTGVGERWRKFKEWVVLNEIAQLEREHARKTAVHNDRMEKYQKWLHEIRGTQSSPLPSSPSLDEARVQKKSEMRVYKVIIVMMAVLGLCLLIRQQNYYEDGIVGLKTAYLQTIVEKDDLVHELDLAKSFEKKFYRVSQKYETLLEEHQRVLDERAAEAEKNQEPEAWETLWPSLKATFGNETEFTHAYYLMDAIRTDQFTRENATFGDKLDTRLSFMMFGIYPEQNDAKKLDFIEASRNLLLQIAFVTPILLVMQCASCFSTFITLVKSAIVSPVFVECAIEMSVLYVMYMAYKKWNTPSSAPPPTETTE